jgi:hypothetical protein
MKKFNGGRGAKVCDHCRMMLTDGKRKLVPFVTVQLTTEQETDDGAAYQEAHFERLACLGSEIARIVAALDSGEEVDDTAADLRRLLLAFARWETAESKVLLPYNDDMDGNGGRMMRIEILGLVNPVKVDGE